MLHKQLHSAAVKDLIIIRKVRMSKLCQTCLETRGPGNIYFIIIIIAIIITRHQLDLDRPVPASSSNFFEGLPSPLRPFGLIQHYVWHPVVVLSCYMSRPI